MIENFRPLSDPHKAQAIAVYLATLLISAGSKEIILQNFTFRVMAKITVIISDLVFGIVSELSDEKNTLN